MVYVVIGIIVVVGGSLLFGAIHIRQENSPGSPPSLIAARRTVRQARMASGELCVCGGTLRPTGQVSDRFGALLGCTGCRRWWTEDGRKTIVRRRQPRRSRPAAPGSTAPPS
jgi:hypothetical protein